MESLVYATIVYLWGEANSGTKQRIFKHLLIVKSHFFANIYQSRLNLILFWNSNTPIASAFYSNKKCLRSQSCWEVEQIVNHNKIRFKQWVLQKTSEKEVDRGEIVHHRHGTVWVTSSGKSEQILNNRQKKIEVLLPEAGTIEKKKRGNMIQSTPTESYPEVSYMRPEGTMKYYTDQTRPDQTRADQTISSVRETWTPSVVEMSVARRPSFSSSFSSRVRCFRFTSALIIFAALDAP